MCVYSWFIRFKVYFPMHSPPFSMCVCSWFIRFIVYFPMQPMWLCFFLDRLFEETFENTQWRKVKQMQPMRLCFFKFENAHWYKSYECNQCDYAFSRQEIWGHIWKRTLEKSQINATNATMHLLGQAIWGDIWKHTMEKSQTNVPSVSMFPLGQTVWRNNWKCTLVKSQTCSDYHI